MSKLDDLKEELRKAKEEQARITGEIWVENFVENKSKSKRAVIRFFRTHRPDSYIKVEICKDPKRGYSCLLHYTITHKNNIFLVNHIEEIHNGSYFYSDSLNRTLYACLRWFDHFPSEEEIISSATQLINSLEETK